MITRLHFSVRLLIAALTLILSCSSGTDPVAPQYPGITPQFETGTTSHYLWAYYNIYLDPETNDSELVPVRLTEGHWNVLKFLEQGPCTNCVKILGITPTPDGTKIFDVQITHPFNNPTYTGFDVRGIAMFNGSKNFPVLSLGTSDRIAGDGALVNADGFTRLYNFTTQGSGPGGLQGYIKGKFATPAAPSSLVNGYKRHITDSAANTRNALFAGSSKSVSYEIDMPDNQLVIGYAIDASWTPPTVTPVTNPMADFPISANSPEAWKVDVTVNPVGDGLTKDGGQAILAIDIFDWQSLDTITQPIIECPDIFNGIVTADWVSNSDGYATYEATVENTKLAPEGEYLCLIKVSDMENSTSPPYLDLSAYQVISLEVGDTVVTNNLPPIAAAHADKSVVMPEEVVMLFDDSTDPDGNDDIIQWEWDFSFDPVDGFNPGDTQQNTQISYTNPGTYKVQLRVTDSESHVDLLDTPLEITVIDESNAPPTAAAHADKTFGQTNESISFFDDSTDPDGLPDITKWEWDFSYDDLDGFNAENLEQNPQHMYTDPGEYKVQLRVTDTALNTDILDTPLTIQIGDFPSFCLGLDEIDNSYSTTYGIRTFYYYEGPISNLAGMNYSSSTGPYNFTVVPPSPESTGKYFLPADPEVSAPAAVFPTADYFFKQTTQQGSQYVAFRLDFDSPGSEGGEQNLLGQYESALNVLNYNESFIGTFPACHPHFDSGGGTVTLQGITFDFNYTLQTVGTGPAMLEIDGQETVINSMCFRQVLNFQDTVIGILNFSILGYYWLDEEGNEIASIQAQNGLDGNNYSGTSFTGNVVCRSLISID
ncbi:MAG TPA: PKD domain-containing protein [bacterium]